MTNRTAATRYARALLDVSVKENADLDQVERDLDSMVELLTQYPTLAAALLNPVVPIPHKRAATDELATLAKLTPTVTKLLGLLADRDRLALVPDLCAAYRERLLDHRHVIRADITTTVALPADRVKAIEAGLARATGGTVTLATHVDPSLLGGVVTRIGGTVYDGSVARQLQKIRERLGESA
jgi:F-type H+-transporting ATPase subunit delta